MLVSPLACLGDRSATWGGEWKLAGCSPGNEQQLHLQEKEESATGRDMRWVVC